MLEYVGVRVRDLERSRRFYCDGLGLRRVSAHREAAGGLRELLEDPESSSRLELNLYPDAPPYQEGDELDHLTFRVRGLEEALRSLVALGGKVRIPVFSVGAGRAAFVSDPDGIWVKLVEAGSSDLPPTSRVPD